MNITKDDINNVKADKALRMLSALFGVDFDEVIKEVEKSAEKDKKTNEKTTSESLVGQPKFVRTIVEPASQDEDQDDLLEDERCDSGYESSFSMSAEELEEFIKDYKKLENTFRKLEHTFGIDLNANADSIYTQYNAIVWNLIEKIFGEDNRDDIADYVFGDSNFDTVEDLYEELV